MELSQPRPLNLRWVYATASSWWSALTVNYDLDNSNLVDIFDYFHLASAWDRDVPEADIDGSGLVDIDDYFLLASHWYLGGDPE